MPQYSYSDIEPVEIASSEPRLASIAYTEEYKQNLGLLLALMGNQEYSDRALALTSKCIDLNPAHYSIWDYRLDILRNTSNEEDEKWLSEMTMDNPKNYQIWNYRQHFLKPKKQFFDDEFTVVKVILGDDAKNFHAWSHLKWVVTQAGVAGLADSLFDSLLQFVEYLLKVDVWNNSCWSFRHFLLYTVYKQKCTLDDDLKYVAEQISREPDNEAAWNYLCGIGASSDQINAIASEHDTLRAIEARAKTDPKLYSKLIELEPWRKGLWEFKLATSNV